MADPASTPATLEQNRQHSVPDNPPVHSDAPPAVAPSPSAATTSAAVPLTVNPNSNPPLMSSVPQPIQQFAPPPISSGGVMLPPAPSFRPAPPPVPMMAPQFSPVPSAALSNSNFQNPNVPPPGVSPVPVMMSYQVPPPGQPPNPALRPYAPVPNGYPAIPAPGPQGAVPPPGVPRYPSPYATMVRPAFPRPPGAIGMLPTLSRPPVPGIPGVRPVIPPVVRPAIVPVAAPTEKPQTTVYVGKIASTVENEFMLSLLQLCGPVKNWKRVQDTDGTPRAFGLCEFESVEGVLRALRLLTKFSVDGQELLLNVDQAAREYLERYVRKKTENSKKPQESDIEKEQEAVSSDDKNEIPRPSVEDSKKDGNELVNKENQDNATFGIVTDEDREVDREALEKLTRMMEERIKTKPLLPPPTQGAADGSENTNSELPTKSRDSDVDIMRSDAAEDDETTSENKHKSDQERLERSSPDRSRRYDRRNRDRELKREKEREFDRLERERERERVRREKDREIKIERAENLYRERVKEWEYREREKDYQRQHEREREKERERERRREISNQERDNDEDDSRKRRRRSSDVEEKRKKRQREKDEDFGDRLKEEEEMVEANKRAKEEEELLRQQQQQQQQEQQEQQNNSIKIVAVNVAAGSEKDGLNDEMEADNKDEAVEQAYEGDSGHQNHIGDGILQNGAGDESAVALRAASDMQTSSLPARKLGFGLVGSGKRTAVPSVFHEEDDDDVHKEKKMRPLVPIDYSTEELQAVQPTISGPSPSNLAAAAEFAKRITNVKDDKSDIEKERNRRVYDRSDHRDRNDEDVNRLRDDSREKLLDRDRDREHGPDKLRTPDRVREHGPDKLRTPDNKKLLDAKQLIDMIPKTKEELFSYEINWAVYDKHQLHERMRPWISKKITEFLGEEEPTLVDYIVSSTKEHVKASQMLELLQSILDDEAEMFVLKMWRMLIFEIKKVETGLSLRSKT